MQRYSGLRQRRARRWLAAGEPSPAGATGGTPANPRNWKASPPRRQASETCANGRSTERDAKECGDWRGSCQGNRTLAAASRMLFMPAAGIPAL